MGIVIEVDGESSTFLCLFEANSPLFNENKHRNVPIPRRIDRFFHNPTVS